MNIVFFIIATIIFFLVGIGSPVLGPNAMVWGHCCVALGLALGGVPWPWRRPG